MVAKSARGKIYAIRQDFIDGQTDTFLLSQKLNLCCTTVNKYRVEFREIARLYPARLKDFKFRLPKSKYIRPVGPRFKEMISLLPTLIDAATTLQVQIIPLWAQYRVICPTGYSLQQFTIYYIAWRRKTNACIYAHRRVKEIHPGDIAVLNEWRNGNAHQWRRATVLLGSLQKRNVHEMAKQVEFSTGAVQRWIDHYKIHRLEGIIHTPVGINDRIRERTKLKQDNLVKLMHQSPVLHGFNRTSWRLEDLSKAYLAVYGSQMAETTVAEHLRRLGFGYRKSREILTSPDPLFREKLDYIKAILSKLGPKEKFFSVDEYGHFSVKIKGGRQFTKDVIATPQVQKSKGWLIVTAALELSTNQVTHFYSRAKDSEEMIKLLDVLLSQYREEEKIYFSWDAASWHASKRLYARIKEVNADPKTPQVELAPLPASAQFLNVIESVFSGLARAVIHNSNYDAVEDCMKAIDRHFLERNEYFLQYPKQAGHMIWGKERVKPVFDEANNCRYNNMR